MIPCTFDSDDWLSSYKLFVGTALGRSVAGFQQMKYFLQLSTVIQMMFSLLHVILCTTCFPVVPLLCCSDEGAPLYPSGPPNPYAMCTIIQ
jgi:hypothetical protein